jgi:Bacterial regulatory proteins, luxR family
MAATGTTNPEIAQQLYLSPRTVSSHLYRLFPKLGITSRSQLAGAIDAATEDRPILAATNHGSMVLDLDDASSGKG